MASWLSGSLPLVVYLVYYYCFLLFYYFWQIKFVVVVVQTLESPEIMLRFPGLESPGKRHRCWKPLEKSWNIKVVVLEILLSGSSIAH